MVLGPAIGLCFQLTVDGNGNGLVENISISSNKSWNFSESVELQIFGINSLLGLGMDNLEVDIVGLCNCENCSAASIALNDVLDG